MFFKTFWKAVSWAVIIIVLSVIPSNEIDSHLMSFMPHQDKIMHFIFYGIFSFLLIRALLVYYKGTRPVWLTALVTFLIIFLFGLTLEIVQAVFTSYRQGDIMDMVFNMAGCVFSILLVLAIPNLRVSSQVK